MTVETDELDAVLSRSETVTRPYDAYRRLRDDHPVFYSERLGCWVVSRYADARAVLDDTRGFSSASRVRRELVTPEVWRAFGGFDGFFWSDPPAYSAQRERWSKAFKPRLKGIPAIVRRVAAELIEQVPAGGSFDIVSSLAFPLPATVVFELLGVPRSDRDWFRRISAILIGGAGAATAAAMDEAAEWLHGFLERRQREPRDDMLSDLIADMPPVASLDPARLRSEVVDIVQFLLAGHETTMSTITSGTLELLQRPTDRERFLQDASVRARAVEEMLRFESPLQFIERRVNADLSFGGHSMRLDTPVRVLLGAANHDERQFAEPGEFRLGRTPNQHVAFGHGPHLCVGAPLARIEIAVAIDVLFDRFPDLELGCAPDDVVWRQNAMFHAIDALPVGGR